MSVNPPQRGEQRLDLLEASVNNDLCRSELESPSTATECSVRTMDTSESGYSISSQTPFLRQNTERNEYVASCLRNEGLDPSTEHEECGFRKFQPNCFQSCANIKIFVCCMCVLLTVAGTLSTGYLNSVITTIETRFEIGSSTSGLIAAAHEFGSLVAVIFVSYLGGRRHIPKWIGRGVIIMAIGAFMFAFPHIIAEKYTVYSGGLMSSNSTDESNMCKNELEGSNYHNQCIDKNSGNWIYVLILAVAQVLIGSGGSPILTLGTTYVDDHVTKEKSPTYLGFIYATGALGPVLGYGLGAILLQYYVDSFSYQVEITPSHPRWIGAWWGGFLICGFLLCVIALPFLSFPKVLVREKHKVLESKTKETLLSEPPLEAVEYGKTIKDIPKSMLLLLKNPIYVVSCFGICCEIAIVSGFVVFLPKYLETQFGTSKSLSSLFTGGIGIPGAVIGIILGGYILKRFQLGPKGAVQLVMLLNAITLFGLGFLFFLGCENPKIAGATFPYFNSTGHKIFEANLTSSCNKKCDCSNNDLEPICGINGITYFSPCHAGCTNFYGPYFNEEKEVDTWNYTGCACIHGSQEVPSEVIMSPLATSGPCKSTCENLLPFLIILVVMTFCGAGTNMPLLMITLRSVREEERAFSLGMQFVILRLFAYIPSPIMFGNTIDTSCLLWKIKCESHGSCLLYDIVHFRYKYIGISTGLLIIGGILFFIVWILIKRRYKAESKVNLNVSDIVHSVGSVNRMDLCSAQQNISTNQESCNRDDQTDTDQNDTGIQPNLFFISRESRV